ncbi:MAG: alcohol dehydrogenase catalytic domain-containing protein [Polyangiaceae bacterium]|nr:alcohol dehydrogenase catalytic domain-containing protein [Polyangiaceae bacterium]
MSTTEFRALEYCSDQTFAEALYGLDGSTEQGYCVTRNGRVHLELGPGYRLLRSLACGVCSTDLDRHCLPFPLPQVTGHELVACDENGVRYVVEINASHHARAVMTSCPYCSSGLERHCPERLVLGINDLPGGFGPWVLAPVGAAIPVPAAIPERAAVLVEPFAAALHAVTTLNPEPGERVAVLGPRRLGLLVVAALSGLRKRTSGDFRILAVARHRELLELASSFGADDGLLVGGSGVSLPLRSVDRVIDTTGTPEGLYLAIQLASREVHSKSTHGRPAAGMSHLTELVVDELGLAKFTSEAVPDGALVAWLVETPPPADLEGRVRLVRDAGAAAARHLLERRERKCREGELAPFDVAVVGSSVQADSAIRPSEAHQRSLVRPGGSILVHAAAPGEISPLVRAVVDRGLRLSSSRCGSFRPALDLLANDPRLCRQIEQLVTHRFSARELDRAFETARSRDCIKAVVEHD